MAFGKFRIPDNAVGLVLCKIVEETLFRSEIVIFKNGLEAVDTALRRAEIAGKVGPVGEAGEFWADIVIDEDGTWVDTISLDQGSYKILKNHWLRCKNVLISDEVKSQETGQ